MTHLTISGDVGSGKSSVALLLSKHLGHSVIAAGDVLRSMAASRGLSTLEMNKLAEHDEALDEQINQMLVSYSQRKKAVIFDSRLAWYLIPSAFKIHLVVDSDVAAQRILRKRTAESYSSVEEARFAAEQRYQSERERFMRANRVDVSRLENYDLVLETSDADPQYIATEIMVCMANRSLPCHLRVSPRRVMIDSSIPVSQQPTQETRSCASNRPSLRYAVVRYQRPRFFLVSGLEVLESAKKRQDWLMPSLLAPEESEPNERKEQVL